MRPLASLSEHPLSPVSTGEVDVCRAAPPASFRAPMLTPPYGIPAAPRSGAIATVEERRGSPRVDLEIDVSVGSEAHYFTAQSGDLSSGGLFVATYRALPTDGELLIEFDLPAGRVVAKGQVRWVREAHAGFSPGYGIAFTALSRFDRTLVDSFCRSRVGPASERLPLAG
jgi:uncharacterized protein (TIGR02266 family)